MPAKVRKAVIPAAGLGTRFLPATKAMPKEMLPIVDVPTIQLVIEEAVAAGIRDIVIINGRNKSSIEDHFDHAYELEHTLRDRGKGELAASIERVSEMARLISVRQKKPLGLGHAVLCARHVIGDEPFAVLLGDDLIYNPDNPGIGQLCDVYEQTGAGAIATMEVAPGQEHLYGVIDGQKDDSGHIAVRDLVEKPAPGTAPSRMAVIGRYVLPAEIWPILENTKPGHGGEIQLTDALRALVNTEQGLKGVLFEGVRHDAGDKVGYLRANISYALQRPDMRDGVLALLEDILANERGTE